MLKRGGVVFGACYDESLKVIHKPITSANELESLRRSKYVESFIGDSFKQAKAYLQAGRLVLFSGVQCQIQGLHSFLRKSYANLLTIEVICNSVPSAKVWEIYKHSLLEEEGEKLLDVNFRGKDYGWGKGAFAIKTKTKTKTKTKPAGKVVYMQGFLRHFITRPSCENCYAKGFKSGADITLGDYWGVDYTHPEFYDTTGVTCALIHSKQGVEFINAIAESMEIVPSTFEKIASWNVSLVRSHPYPKRPFITQSKVLREIITTYEQTNDPHKALKPLERACLLDSIYELPTILKWRLRTALVACLPKPIKLYLKSKLRRHNG